MTRTGQESCNDGDVQMSEIADRRIVTFGEIMLRLSPPGYLRFTQATNFDAIYGGGEANVAESLANFGMSVDFVSRLPDNELGQSAVNALRSKGVGLRHVLRGGSRLGIFFCEKGGIHRGSNVIYDRAGSAFSTLEPEMFDWKSILDGASWFHWSGIKPAVSESAAQACADAIRTANDLGIPVSTDLNYRRKLWNRGRAPEKVMADLASGCRVIVGNEEDIQQVFGIHPEGVDVTRCAIDAGAYESVARRLMDRFPNCEKVAITLRGSVSASHNTWSGVLWNGRRLIRVPTYEIVPIVDRVGSGDAFMGGLIYGLLGDGGDDGRSLHFAVAASCLKHTIFGDANLVTIEEIERLMAGDSSGRIIR